MRFLDVPFRDLSPSPARSISSGGDDARGFAPDDDATGHSCESLRSWLRGCRASIHHLTHDHSTWGLKSTLGEQIVHELPGVNNDKFIPVGQLESLLCESNVTVELARLAMSESSFWHGLRHCGTARNVAKTICRGAGGEDARPDRCLRKIFATLLLIGYPAAIGDFIGEKLWDEDLPLRTERDPGSDKLCLHLSDRTGKGELGRKLPFSENWQPHQVDQFASSQWKVLAPFFSRLEWNYGLFSDEIILPFTALESIKSGGYSHAEIYHGEIHPQHHDFPCDVFAVKSIRVDDLGPDQFQKEVEMLRRVSNNEHIIDLFGTYQHRGSYHLILPRAECDLETYWKSVSHGDLSENTAVLPWMAQQCEGLASGLNQVHHHFTTSMSSLFRKKAEKLGLISARKRTAPLAPDHPRKYQFHGVHGDIKPSNILWFPGPTTNGTLKITDFGTGEYSDTESTRRPSDSVPFTPSYQPPERALDIDDEVDISWAYDVWMLGCLYLEFATWVVGRYPMLDEFTRSRRPAHADRGGASFFDIQADGQAVVKPEVEQVRLM